MAVNGSIPTELLNRWIIPLENRIDYMVLSNGRKIEVPFEQLIIFSTNLEPNDLADDAFLRRIPFKVEIGNPSPQEFHLLFQIFARNFSRMHTALVDYLISKHYHACSRPLRRCYARDLWNKSFTTATTTNCRLKSRRSFSITRWGIISRRIKGD